MQIGNVYAHFREEDQAAAALRGMTGRFYAGIFLSSSPIFFFFMYEIRRTRNVQDFNRNFRNWFPEH